MLGKKLVELDISLNINRESLSTLRREYSSNNSGRSNKVVTLHGLEYSQFDISNKLLKLGDFFISTSNYIIHKYLLSEKKAITELIEEVRQDRCRQVDKFLTLYPNIPEDSLAELKFIISDSKKDKSRLDLSKGGRYTDRIKLIPTFRIFEKVEPPPVVEFASID